MGKQVNLQLHLIMGELKVRYHKGIRGYQRIKKQLSEYGSAKQNPL